MLSLFSDARNCILASQIGSTTHCVFCSGPEDYPNTWDSFRTFNMPFDLARSGKSHRVTLGFMFGLCQKRRCHNDEEDFLVCHRRMLYDLETSLQKMLGGIFRGTFISALCEDSCALLWS